MYLHLKIKEELDHAKNLSRTKRRSRIEFRSWRQFQPAEVSSSHLAVIEHQKISRRLARTVETREKGRRDTAARSERDGPVARYARGERHSRERRGIRLVAEVWL